MKILNNKKILMFVVALSPMLALAQSVLIPCDGVDKKCDFNTLMMLVKNIIDYLVWIALPLAVISFAWAGIKIMIAGDNVGERKAGIKMMWTTAQGFIVLLAAWLIVKTILDVLLNETYKAALPIQL